jgi:4-alpha-glucanotransferase
MGSAPSEEDFPLVSSALAALGIDRLLLTVHDASFPLSPEEDVGRGSPGSSAGLDFLRFVRGLGFTGVQLGPQGKTSLHNPSPFDGTLFARSSLSIALGPLSQQGRQGPDDRWSGLLAPALLRRLCAGRPPDAGSRVAHAYAWQAQEEALRAAFAELRGRQGREAALAARVAAFREASAGWLPADSRYEALCRRYGGDDWRQWPPEASSVEASKRSGDPVPPELETESAFNDFVQFIAHTQHDELRGQAGRLSLKLYGDLQVGTSLRDLWRYRPLFLRDYVMGAPPSRTNPEGQPWGYPVLDPRGYFASAGGEVAGEGPGLAFFRSRLHKALAEFDGLRIDHPHGLCCPWVYRADAPDPVWAVQNGARLGSSPNLLEHPSLSTFAIARPEQLHPDRGHPRYADDWVQALTPEQITRYSILFDALLAAAAAEGRDREDIACEVLSTCPFPLAAVLARHGLGRFRVTQKADPLDPRDPYRTAEASPGDWVMLGTHDTPPIWQMIDTWAGTAQVSAWAAYLALRLEPIPAMRAGFAATVERDPRALAAAMFADLFVGPARQVSVFFPDLFGMKETYNRPGIVDPANWSLRVPADWRSLHAARCQSGEALDLRAALVQALRARAGGSDGTLTALARALESRTAS